MKKLPQSAGAKAQNSRQRMQRRNFQKNATRRTGVHPVAENPRNPQPRPREKRKPYKLQEATFKRLIGSIDGHCDAPMYVHLHAAGIHHDTFNEWKRQAAENPDGLHAFYLDRVEKALARAWGRLHEKAVHHKASEVLFRMHPDAYPSERRRLELTGLEGTPLIPTENAFSVVIELAGSPSDNEREFVIEQVGGPNDGKREIWQPNGQKPT